MSAQKGKVLSWIPKGYGFVRLDTDPEDKQHFVHHSVIQVVEGGYRSLVPGTEVEVILGETDEQGRSKAAKVMGLGGQPLPSGPRPPPNPHHMQMQQMYMMGAAAMGGAMPPMPGAGMGYGASPYYGAGRGGMGMGMGGMRGGRGFGGAGAGAYGRGAGAPMMAPGAAPYGAGAYGAVAAPGGAYGAMPQQVAPAGQYPPQMMMGQGAYQ
jgi:cold shock CspA family protein